MKLLTYVRSKAMSKSAPVPRPLFPDVPAPQVSSDDPAKTLNACALGWSITEVLGIAFEEPEKLKDRKWSSAAPDPLPLANERSISERQIALVIYAWRILHALELGDLAAPPSHARDGQSQYVDIIMSVVKNLAQRKPCPTDEQRGEWRAELNEYMYWWDQQLQDVLPSISQRAYAGYQAARGLADLAWICPRLTGADRAQLVKIERINLLGRLILSLA